MDSKITSRVNGYIVQIIFKGSLCVLCSFYIGPARMNLATYIDHTTIDVYAMICINCTMIILCSSILCITCRNIAHAGIDIYGIQRN